MAWRSFGEVRGCAERLRPVRQQRPWPPLVDAKAAAAEAVTAELRKPCCSWQRRLLWPWPLRRPRQLRKRQGRCCAHGCCRGVGHCGGDGSCGGRGCCSGEVERRGSAVGISYTLAAFTLGDALHDHRATCVANNACEPILCAPPPSNATMLGAISSPPQVMRGGRPRRVTHWVYSKKVNETQEACVGGGVLPRSSLTFSRATCGYAP